MQCLKLYLQCLAEYSPLKQANKLKKEDMGSRKWESLKGGGKFNSLEDDDNGSQDDNCVSSQRE